MSLEVLALGLGEEADVPEVDAEQRRPVRAGQLGAAQQRAVAAEHDTSSQRPRRLVRVVDDLDRVHAGS